MVKKIFSSDDLESKVTGRAHFLNTYQIDTSAGIREVVGRKSGHWLGAKVLPLFVSNKIARRVRLSGRCSFQQFKSQIKKKWLFPSLEIGLIAIDRPVTYVRYSKKINISANYIYEIPGGIVDEGEKIRRAALREGYEELGFHPICSATLSSPAPFDSGTHFELTQLEVALCAGGINPKPFEGILVEKCRMIGINEFPKFVSNCESEGILVDGIAQAAYYKFMMMILS